MQRIELMNASTHDELSVSDTSGEVTEENSKELLPLEEELLLNKSENGGITSEEEEKMSGKGTDEGFETDPNKNDESAGYPTDDLSEEESQIQTEDNSFEGRSVKTSHNETKDTITSVPSSREEGQFDSAEMSNAGGFCLIICIAGTNTVKITIILKIVFKT